MHMIACILACLARLPLLQQYLWLACNAARAIASDLVDPETGWWSHRDADWFLRADRLVRDAHRLLDHAIASRACQLAGLPAPKRPSLHTLGRTLPTRLALWKRATEIVLRARNLERNAQRLAAKLMANPLARIASASTLSSAQAPSTASPAKAGAQPARAARFLTTGKLFEAFGFEYGRPPARATRLMDCAPRDGPACAGTLSATR